MQTKTHTMESTKRILTNNKVFGDIETLTPRQLDTVNQVVSRIEKWNTETNVYLGLGYPELTHISLQVIETIIGRKYEVINTYCNITINTRGTIVKGKWHNLTPIKTEQVVK